jgi:hypothetical protein
MPDHHRFDFDPEALAWARAHVQAEVDRFVKFERQAIDKGDREQAMNWRRMANMLRMSFIGGTTCVVARFDERRPQFKETIEKARSQGSEVF